MRTSSSSNPASAAASGFSMVEMVVAMLVLMVGLLSMASAVSYALSVTNRGRGVTNTKLLIVSMLEQMENLRNTKELTFAQIRNAGTPDDPTAPRPFAGFPTGFETVSVNPGPDGIYGTSDDLVDAGNDGVYGTSDDYTNSSLARAGYERQVTITDLSLYLKKVEVTLRYPDGNGVVRTMSGISYLNNDSRSNTIR